MKAINKKPLSRLMLIFALSGATFTTMGSAYSAPQMSSTQGGGYTSYQDQGYAGPYTAPSYGNPGYAAPTNWGYGPGYAAPGYAEQFYQDTPNGLANVVQVGPSPFMPPAATYVQSMSCSAGTMAARTGLSEFSTPVINPEYKYHDLFERCQNTVSELRVALNNSQLTLKKNPIGAVKSLVDKLKIVSAQYGMGQRNISPHTALAITEGSKILGSYWASASMVSSGNRATDEIKGQVLYSFASSVYNYIFNAMNLDRMYFPEYERVCVNGRHCYTRGNESDIERRFRNPQAYFDGTRKLAVSILDLLFTYAEVTGYDAVELPVTATVARTAMELLNSSPFRRRFSCDVVALWNVVALIEQKQCNLGPIGQVDSYDLIDRVHEDLSDVYQNLENHRGGICW